MHNHPSDTFIIDSHCHLNDAKLINNVDSIISDAKKKGVIAMHTICTQISEFNSVHKIALDHENVFSSVGVHPLNVSPDHIHTAEEIAHYTHKAKVISIGETGLDYYYNHTEEQITLQKQSFIEHIKASQATDIPLVIHARDADHDMVDIMQKHYARKPFRGVIHCFTASAFLAREVSKMDFYISASGIITFKNAKEIIDVFASYNLDRILVETDAPYLAPTPYRGKMNKPEYVCETTKKLSEILSIEYASISNITSNNFCTLFNKATIIK